MRSTAAPYTESRLARLVRNKRVGFPVVEQSSCFKILRFLLSKHFLILMLEVGSMSIREEKNVEYACIRIPIFT